LSAQTGQDTHVAHVHAPVDADTNAPARASRPRLVQAKAAQCGDGAGAFPRVSGARGRTDRGAKYPSRMHSETARRGGGGGGGFINKMEATMWGPKI
jgi:hypothetical protein